MRVSVCHAPPPLNRSHRLPYQGTADYELFFLLLLVGTAETIGFKQIYDMMDGADRDAGDFGFDPLMLLKGNEVQYKEAELVHTAFVSEQERQARAAAGAQKQLDEAATAAKKREKEKERKKRQKEAKKAAAQAEREQELPAAPTLGAYIDKALG